MVIASSFFPSVKLYPTSNITKTTKIDEVGITDHMNIDASCSICFFCFFHFLPEVFLFVL
jgi:hypothetical protein